MSDILAILGSSRSDGETARLLHETLMHLPGADFHDLGALAIGPYSYDHAHAGDDFLPLAQKMTKARAIVFASPVYWYSMSAQMKAFFDRLTDLTDAPWKPVGKSLAGRTMFLVGTGGSDAAPSSFIQPFEDTAGYFDMTWGGALYRPGADELSDEDKLHARAFAKEVNAVL